MQASLQSVHEGNESLQLLVTGLDYLMQAVRLMLPSSASPSTQALPLDCAITRSPLESFTSTGKSHKPELQ